MRRLRKRVWVPSACVFGVIAITCLAWRLPGPIEGAYKSPYVLCCGEGYDFFYFETNAVRIFYEQNPPAFHVGNYFKTNGAWYLRSQGRTNPIDHRVEPHLLFIRFASPSTSDPSNTVTAWRSFRFRTVGRVLNDPRQWMPEVQMKE